MRNKKFFKILFLVGSIMLLPSLSFAAGGIDKVNTFLQNISTALYAIGAIVLTIAFMWAGFKIMFQGQTLQQVAPTFIGGVIVGCASAIAGYIIS
ncbi:conjugal transfer protein TraC [Campylobacter sp. MIT 12-8780]|uniref:TrbC/VirB2 family protein n=1 Tax=unclassified Campylobacter TaxID=2593542 RepID=UPI0010F6A606|nr:MULTISPECIES: TrbC/VirB2 family protein [unclassified Campylobacter]NDJ28077.1 TrbC/VirB2 family protein [Campylobacter sp. MIT 19-121]TKX28258.1 conjugal transfer protein TraC [Campylobacter sp. MIT 12-5580]TQR39958.1 conjugal transfer protein TraC [Campylobacter sp. MIT 12-8780]